jgi:hypothetical protein
VIPLAEQVEMFPELVTAVRRLQQRSSVEAIERFLRAAQGQLGLVPQFLAARMVRLSKSRIGELVESKRIQSVELFGVPLVSCRSLLAWYQSDRKPGRPKTISASEAASPADVSTRRSKAKRKVQKCELKSTSQVSPRRRGSATRKTKGKSASLTASTGKRTTV